MTAGEPLLRLIRLTKRYEAPSGQESLTVLDAVSFELHRGESLAIVGPSGSGKSTLLQIIGTLDQQTSGQVLLDGEDLGQLDEAGLARVRNVRFGFVFQAHYLLGQCTVLENVLAPTLAASNARLREAAVARARRLLERVGLSQRLTHRPSQLSGGECQRVAVVRALINQPQLLLADEPTGALDQEAARRLGQLLVDLNREEGVALIVVTHSQELAATMGRVLALKAGRLEAALGK